MKNKLLITTAIVAIGLASNVWADTSYTATSSTYAVAPNGTIVNSEGSIVDLGKITYEEGTITTTLDLTDVSVSNEAGIKYGVLSNILTADEKSIIAGNVNIINGTISNNTSTGTGAVTLWVNSNYTGGALSHSITGTVFNNNTSARKGGA